MAKAMKSKKTADKTCCICGKAEADPIAVRSTEARKPTEVTIYCTKCFPTTAIAQLLWPV